MYRQQVYVVTNIIILIDALIVIAAGYGAYYTLWFLSHETWWMEPLQFYASVLGLMFLNNFLMAHSGFYSDQRFPSFFAILRKLVFVVFIDFAILGTAIIAFDLVEASGTFISVFAGYAFAGFVLSRVILDTYIDRINRKGFNCRRILLVGSDKRAADVDRGLAKQRSWGHRVIGYLKTREDAPSQMGELLCLGTMDSFDEVLLKQRVDEVVFALPSGEPRNLGFYLEMCEEMGVQVRIVPGMFDPLSGRAQVSVETIQGIPTISFQSVRINASGLFYKRVLDFFGGLVGMAILALMYPFIALAIKLDSPGPVLFKQKRVGMNGRVFGLYKFRTMSVDAELRKKELMSKNEMNGFMFKLKDDPRITRVGRFLRKTSLDEFPQFINVMRGEISLVGTRPPTEDEVLQYEKWHRRRISMKPGITGYWQVSGRNVIKDFNEVVQLDLKYIDGWKFSRDLEILVKTIWVVLTRQGAS